MFRAPRADDAHVESLGALGHLLTDVTIADDTDRAPPDFTVVERGARRASAPTFLPEPCIDLLETDPRLEHRRQDELGDSAFVFEGITDGDTFRHGFRRAEIIPSPGNLEELHIGNFWPGLGRDVSADDGVGLIGHGRELTRIVLGRIPDMNLPAIIKRFAQQTGELDGDTTLDECCRHGGSLC